jgi:hypothetical protein
MASTIKSGSNNDLYIQTDGVDRIVVDSNGNTSIIGSVLSVENATGWGEAHLNGATGGDLILQDDGVNIGEVYAGVGHGMTVKSFAGHGINFITNNDTSKMTIDTAGRVTMPYQPKFLVGFTTTGQISVPDANVIPFNYTGGQGTFDVGSNFNTSTSRFTAPVAGHYFLQANITAVTSSTVSAQIMKNGAAITNGGDTMASFINGINNSATMNTTLIVYLAVGDYVDARTRNATYNVYKNHTWFLGYLIG